MEKIKSILISENYKLVKKYTVLSVFGYLYVFTTLYILVDFFSINKTISFILSYGSWYIVLYVLQLKYLFQTHHNKRKMLRFYASLLFFYIWANLFYNLGIKYEIHYLLSTLITIIILLPLRFVVSKMFVFKD
ncbi:hypothetical protein ES711_14940 [Gelidibacter salicanalis]|uniref:GtrA/DPMS transmembrane domain-containing protein n=1 Tax=Gelidibacter salicanalis TaxID=291193 RepID=A0A5C7AD99_9FLAO|nr:hypothetical protein ES711_14940 [Gelidibacter salicanalis]